MAAQLVSSITKNYPVICMEDLNIKEMKRNHELAKSISSVGWFGFKQKLKHKLAETGGFVVDINRFAPSSKMCSSCGLINDNLTLDIREWDCKCGAHHDRDINAAVNIRTFGVIELNRLGTSRIHACGEPANGDMTYDISSYGSLKQENLPIVAEDAESLVRQ